MINALLTSLAQVEFGLLTMKLWRNLWNDNCFKTMSKTCSKHSFMIYASRLSPNNYKHEKDWKFNCFPRSFCSNSTIEIFIFKWFTVRCHRQTQILFQVAKQYFSLNLLIHCPRWKNIKHFFEFVININLFASGETMKSDVRTAQMKSSQRDYQFKLFFSRFTLKS